MTTPFPRRKVIGPTDGACDAVSHSFENVSACQSALLVDVTNFQAIGRLCKRRDVGRDTTALHVIE
ncbi:hypothetical protein [Bradyrhizobium sp. USDA 3364]